MNDDERLKHAFEKLREDDTRRAPSFDDVRSLRPRSRSRWAVVVPLASAAAAAAVFIVWCNVAQDAAPPVASVPAPANAPVGGESIAYVDEAPLDFLLDVPGFRGTPNFDTSLPRGSVR